MQPLEKAHLIENPEKDAAIKKTILDKFPNVSEKEIEALMEETRDCKVFMNDIYTVYVKDAEVAQGFPEMIWLSVKRNDRQPIHDWRDLQEIKNQLVGKENEAVELYPAQSRVLDTANQYHLWVLKDPKIKFPFGFKGGIVDYEMAEKVGGVQRKQEGATSENLKRQMSGTVEEMYCEECKSVTGHQIKELDNKKKAWTCVNCNNTKK